MKHILILGAGRSSTSLIDYLSANCEKEGWTLTIGEKDAESTLKRFPQLDIVGFEIEDTIQATVLIAKADLVISMLPAIFHYGVAKICAEHGISLLTASYLSPEIKALGSTFEKKGACCLMEMGLDPGIDHMSAMKVLDRIKAEGHQLLSFETFTGGLLAENKEDDNPWQYKFTWNPRNVVLAGSGSVKFLQEGRFKYIPYHRLFRRTEVIHIPGHGYFEGYANRDSLNYMDVYKLRGIKTLYRGTLRRPGFCKGWDIFVQIGATDDSYKMENVSEMTHRQFINSFLSYNPDDSVELKIAHYMNLNMESEEMYKLKHLGMFDDELVGLDNGTPAQILEHILKKKWTLLPTDKDMIIMWHKFVYNDGGERKEIQSSMVAIGDDMNHTAMSKTVGLPLGIIAKLILKGKVKLSGVLIPTIPEIYNPVLDELNEMGFQFDERQI
ncbi:MAG: saccharopine dehydrogenase-like NADP-dependent oxidoreductase [Cyclobacteriaceae bacterium]|jgi:saccharopine dehydrogenase-like NADP-dependent oxidoreductase